MADRYSVGLVCSLGVGPERGGRRENQDNYLVARNREARFLTREGERVQPSEGDGVMLVVADGMGGHDAGDVASGAAVRALARLHAGARPTDPELALHRFLLQAHERLHGRAADRGQENMGTTVVAAWLLDGVAYWAHVGDSRLYHLRRGRLRCLTRDHTQAEFARRDGRAEPANAGWLAQSFVFGSRGLGSDAGIRIDAGTDTGGIPLEEGDRLLLCTDGLSGFVEDSRILDTMREVSEPAACATWLAERAMASGSNDNITVLVAQVDRLEPRPEPRSACIPPEEEGRDEPPEESTAEQLFFDDGLVPPED